MPIYTIDGHEPEFEERDTNFVAPDAVVIGRCRIGRDVSIWFGSVMRGDNDPITVGARSNIQEQSVMHTDYGYPLTIGEGCTIGHKAMLHGCSIGDNTLIGMGAIVLNGARIGRNSIVGAGALVTEGKEFPDNSLIVGAPAKAIRKLDDEAAARLSGTALGYVGNWQRFLNGLRRID
jgi:carbonic anhydrase/acetyltransferase-like protein (isoleucine patch superfamily)